MKNLLLLILLFIWNSNLMIAQSRRSVRVKAGENIAQAYSPNGFYRFPQFSKCTVFFKDGQQRAGQLFNFNVLSGTMQLISPVGDTLDIVAPANVDSIAFEKNIFIYNNGYMEVVARIDSIALLKKIIIQTQVEKIGAYGQPRQTGSIDNISVYSAGNRVYNFVINADVLVIENIYWYWMDRKNKLLKATKGNLLKLLPANRQSEAEAYIKQTKINFEKETDLKELMTNLTR